MTNRWWFGSYPKIAQKREMPCLCVDNSVQNGKRSLQQALRQLAPNPYILAIAMALCSLAEGLIHSHPVLPKVATPTHIEKQSATLALLAAHELRSPGGQMLIAYIQAIGRRPDFSEFWGDCKQLAITRGGFLDNLRMTLAYEDAKPQYDKMSSVRAAKGLAKDLRRWAKDAVKRRKSTRTMNLAAEIYKNDLGRL